MVKGNHEIIKSINISLVLDAIRVNKEISRSELSRTTGLTTGTITNITTRLIDLGLVEESGSSVLGTGGRKPILLRLRNTGAYAIAIDVRTTSIEISLVDLNAKALESIKKDGSYTVEEGIKEIIEGIRFLVNKWKVSDKLLGIGISLPGWLDHSTGKIIRLPNLIGWDNYPIKQELESALSFPVFIENDANLSALGESWYGKGKSYQHMIYVLVEDGIGTGLILNQQIYRGNGIGVGELGHLPIATEQRLCSCGNVGCLDTIAPAKAMIERYQEQTNEEVTFDDFLALINAKDAVAIKLMNEAAYNLGVGISILVNLFHPEAIFFGGKVIESIPNFLSLVKQTVHNKALDPMLQNMVIASSDSNDNSSILGAIALVFQATLQPYTIKSI